MFRVQDGETGSPLGGAAGSQCTDSARQFGHKRIGFLAGCALLVNNITGPGVPQLPNMFVEAGWLVPTVVILTVWVMTTVSSSMFCEAMRRIPGNEFFQNRVEYTTIVKHYFGSRWYVASQIGLNGALQALCIISVIQSTQIMDQTVALIFGKTCAINLTPFQNVWTDSTGTGIPVEGSTSFLTCIDTTNYNSGNAWGCHVVVTVGFAITAALAIPCGRWNLDDNMLIQTVAFGLTICCWLVWVIASLSTIEGEVSLPAINSEPRTGSLAGTIGAVLFNFGFVTTVPSWVNEKHRSVSANRSLWFATALCVLVFFAVSLSGALAFQDSLQGPVTATCRRQALNPSFNCYNDIMQAVSGEQSAWHGSSTARLIIRLSVQLFPIVSVISSIPVFSIVIKYNMVENGFSPRFSFCWGVLFPWVAAFPLLYMPNVLAQFINFSSLLFVSFTDFVVPLMLYIVLHKDQGDRGDRGLLEAPRCPAGGRPVDDGRVHHAFPPQWGLSANAKRRCAATIAVLLITAAVVGAVLTVVQGTYEFTAQTCALVGS